MVFYIDGKKVEQVDILQVAEEISLVTGKKLILDQADPDTYISHDDSNNWITVFVDNTEVARFLSTGKLAVNALDGGADPNVAELTVFDDHDDLALLDAWAENKLDELPESVCKDGWLDQTNVNNLLRDTIRQQADLVKDLQKQVLEIREGN